ncbi:MAG: hypothetical protein KIG74_04410, partial [Clostridiaceae bacterium]|nr:hypothetical protein [Clostridiaceae bacterium]
MLPLSENDLARFKSDAAGEYAYPRTQYETDSAEYSAKMRAAPELDNLLSTAEYSHWAKDNKNHPEATLGFDYYKTKFILDGHLFEGLINIANSENGRVFYDITKIKEIPDTSGKYAARLTRPSSTFGNLSDTTVTQNTPDVKNSIRNRNETDTQSALRAQAEETVRAVMESYPANLQEARITAVAQSLRETGETALADEVIRVWQDAGGENVVYYAKKAAENAAETENAGYGREGETGGVRLRAGGERNDGQSTGRQIAGVAETAGRTPAADERRQLSAKQSKSKRIAERIARGGGKSTRAATGLKNASRNSRYQVYELEERDMDAEAYEIINDATANGYEAHLYYKGLYFNVKAGRTIRVDGARSGDRLYIRMDAEHFTGRQIANHEMFHALAEGNPGLVDAIMQDIMSEYTEEELEELVA